jgi:hypothetical protein
MLRTENRLDCCFDYASARRRPTSTTSKTFGRADHAALDQFFARLSGARRGVGVPVPAGFCWSGINAIRGMAAMNGI